MASRQLPGAECGFPELEHQHARLFEVVDAACAAVRSKDVASARRALQALADELLSHFAAEDRLMAAHAYPERERHGNAHDVFMQDFLQLTRELDATGVTPTVTLWMTSRVPEWLRFHVAVNDVPLGRFLAGRIAPPAPTPTTRRRA